MKAVPTSTMPRIVCDIEFMVDPYPRGSAHPIECMNRLVETSMSTLPIANQARARSATNYYTGSTNIT